jgi:3-oxoacyl-[acyl-carrier protein] reductase
LSAAPEVPGTAAAVTLVTGGTRGIGRAVVEALVGEGRQAAFTWKSDEAAARELERGSGGLARAWRLDLGEAARPEELVREIESSQGEIRGLVNNAGIARDRLLALTSDEDWDAVVNVNLGGTFRMCRAVLRGMMARRSGSIVNVSSLSALHGVAGQAEYAASKSAVLALTRSLARETGKRGIRVNAVVPGFVATEMTAGLPPEVIASLRSSECLRSGTSPRDVADAVLFLLSDRSGAVTGQSIVVDAGTSA